MNMGILGAPRWRPGLPWLRAAPQAETYEVATRTDIVFAEHDGVKLVGDLYLPKGLRQGAGHGRGPRRRLAGRQPLVYRIGGRSSPRTASPCSRSTTGCRSPA